MFNPNEPWLMTVQANPKEICIWRDQQNSLEKMGTAKGQIEAKSDLPNSLFPWDSHSLIAHFKVNPKEEFLNDLPEGSWFNMRQAGIVLNDTQRIMQSALISLMTNRSMPSATIIRIQGVSNHMAHGTVEFEFYAGALWKAKQATMDSQTPGYKVFANNAIVNDWISCSYKIEVPFFGARLFENKVVSIPKQRERLFARA